MITSYNINIASIRHKLLKAKSLPEIATKRPAGVLAIFLQEQKEICLLFTKRSASLSQHAGQISFPGGALEENDVSQKAAALRETQEEVGIAANELELIAPLPPQDLLTNWTIQPFAAFWKKSRPIDHNPAEVDKVILYPLKNLWLQHQQNTCQKIDGKKMYRYDLDGELLWGATAKIVGQMLDTIFF